MTIETQNKTWGFFGTLCSNCPNMGGVEAAATYDAIAQEVLIGKHGMSDADAVVFLDSRSGRHLCDAMTTWNGFSFAHVPTWLPKEIRRFYATGSKVFTA